MDPSIMKLLEEDEDETMHSGADVEAFQAALNRDISCDTSMSLPQQSDSGPFHGDSQISSQSYPGWPSSSQVETVNPQSGEGSSVGHLEHILPHEAVSSEHQNEKTEGVNYQPLQQKQPQDGLQQVNRAQDSAHMSQATTIQSSQTASVPLSEPARAAADGESQYLKLQKMSNQQASVPEQAGNRGNRPKQVPFALLLPVILPQLDKDRAMQLQTLYTKLKNNDIPKDGFVRIMRGIVGDQMLKMAVMKMQAQPPSQQMHMQASGSIRPSQPRMQPAAKLGESQSSSQMQIPGPNYGSGNSYRPFSGTNVPNPRPSINPQHQDLALKQFQNRPSVGSSQMVMATQAMNAVPKLETQSSVHDHRRLQSGSAPSFASNASSQQTSVPWRPPISKEQGSGPFSSLGYVKHEPSDHPGGLQQKPSSTNFHGLPSVPSGQLDRIHMPSASKDNSMEQQPSGTHTIGGNTRQDSLSTVAQNANSKLAPSLPSNNVRTPSKKPSVGQKKPLDTVGSSPPSASKKQKVSGGMADQSIEQLIDVTAVSGVNLREEEEQLFSGPKEDSRASEASRKVVQEEEETLILQRGPLQKKMAEIMEKCGVKNMSNDVERCLSLCVEERLRGLLCNLIRVSKQRVDVEKTRHRTVVSSDIRQQLMVINRKAREEWDKKQAEVEKLQKLNDPEGNQGIEAEKEKDDGRGKSVKVNKEEDDKMRTTAANVAARAAVGGDDMLSKWQLMAEQARQKCGVVDTASGSQSGKDNRKSIITPGNSRKDNQEPNKRGQVSGAPRKFGRNSVVAPHPKVNRTISVKDMIAVLEREPQMSKSSLIYRLYGRVRSETTTE